MDRATLARAVFEEGWNRQDYSRVGDALQYVRLHVGEVDRQLDLDAVRDIIAGWHDAFSDFRFEVHTVVASGDHAAIRATLHGTNDGPWRGAPPTGRTVAVEHMFFLRFEADAVVEVWELLDRDAFEVDASKG
ncbi:ester cyclase [Microbacterium hominis]|uniref:Ester cyclase n=1 Tax=Microbacterium hominis TaxID=162426 RepID=A0A7D4TPU6_9MICO|nr:ester cyclase [Microbacterium hominis]QKJ18564.1 ester cyclase [Microbacterium hominis]